ncbi:MAG: hypothetical protein QOD84_2655 [Acidobacteriaceae bacterium]
MSPKESSVDSKSKKELKPLKITCTSTDCENGLHCFRVTKKMIENNAQGHCRSCGVSLVDWNRFRKLDLQDVAHTFAMLKLEMIRHHFWHLQIDPKAVKHARRKGKIGMRAAAENRSRKSVGPAEPSFDGRQTPKSGNSLFYAQHATATCCRKCIQEWHGVPVGKELTNDEVNYFTELLMLFVNERLPQLTEDGEKLPRK